MSMNNVLEQLELLLRELDDEGGFNSVMKRQYDNMQTAYETVAPLWRGDSMEREFTARYADVGQAMENYIRSTGPTYVEFLRESIDTIRRYLDR